MIHPRTGHPHVLWLVVDPNTGDAWPEWHYTRKRAREYADTIFRATGYPRKVVKYVPAPPKRSNG